MPSLSFGEWIVYAAGAVLILVLIHTLVRYDLLDPHNSPTPRQIVDSLKHGKPLSAQWRPVDGRTAGAYGIQAFCILGLALLFFCKRWIVDLLNSL